MIHPKDKYGTIFIRVAPEKGKAYRQALLKMNKTITQDIEAHIEQVIKG